MAIEKRVVIGQVSINELGVVSVRKDTIIEEDGVELSRSFVRETLMPGMDVSAQPEMVAAIAEAAWTPDVLAKAALRFVAPDLAKRT